MKVRYWLLIILAGIGLADAGYLTFEHYSQVIPPCPVHASIWIDCGAVLRSKYAVMFGVPLAVWGVINYGLMLVWLWRGKKSLALAQSWVALGGSIYFVYLMLWVIKAICLYCMVSALTSTILFICIQLVFAEERKRLFIVGGRWLYQNIFKPIFFLIDPETVHVSMMKSGETMVQIPGVKTMMRTLVKQKFPILRQKLAGIDFEFPIGLAAGFDYEARLTQTLEPLGFGFQSVGTITNLPCEGNDKPRLGRLPESRSLMVNKGFRNPGAEAIGGKLKGMEFGIPVGISVGRTNVKREMDEKEAIEDILVGFRKLEVAHLNNAYYELNISCPNLNGGVSFYPPEILDRLLTAVDKLKLKKPIWVKMPINETNADVLKMLEVIARHSPEGAIFGNLQKDRKNPVLNQGEVMKWPKGNFSGKPTFGRSNELVALAYKKYKKRFVIIGCGGVFSAGDAYTKIKKGASLVQLITGMIYQGPQLISEINFGLADLLVKDGYKNIFEAVGVEA